MMGDEEISKSQEFKNTLDDIALQIWEYKAKVDKGENSPSFVEFDIFEEQVILEEQFINKFKQLLAQCTTDNFYWQYCPIEIYRSHFESRKKGFIKKYINATACDFIQEELEAQEQKELNYNFKHPRYFGEEVTIPFNPMGSHLSKTLRIIRKRKIEFLETELKRIEKHPEFYSDYFENILPPNYIRDIKNRNKILAGFITSADNGNQLELLPYTDFLKQYNQLSEEDQLKLLFELKRLILNGAISKAYLLKEWKDINLKSFVNSQLDSISRINDLETEMQNNKLNDTGGATNNSSSTEKNVFDKKKTIPSELFTPEGQDIFLLLNIKYQSDNKFLPTKFSNIYRVMDEFNLIIGTQDQYKDFIKSEYGVVLSKIMNNEYKESPKYKQKRKPYLISLIKDFQKNN